VRRIKQIAPALALLLVVAFLVKRYLVHPSPDRILQQTLERYESLEFYSDTTTVSSNIASLEGSYEFAYGRPNRLRVQFRELLDDELVVVDGTTLYVYRPSGNEYRARPAPRQLSDELPGAQQMLKLSLLNGTASRQGLGKARYRGRQKLGGRWVHRLEVAPQPTETDEHGAQAAGSRREDDRDAPLPPNRQGLPRMTLWVGVEDALVYRTDMTLTVGSGEMTHSLVCDRISTEPIPAGTFTFEPPPGARAVARFEAPQVEPDIVPSTEGETRDEQE
jgi:outer membrane lipoprotein-sorting protein